REVDDFEQFWDSASKHGLKLPPNRNSKMWAAATKENGFENISLKASTSFNHTNIGALFTLKLEPMTWERPSRFQRRFGHDRFLFVEFPNIDNLPTHIKEQRGNIREGFRRWLSEPKTFLGRTWESIMIVDVKRRETRNESAAGHRVTLFATRGYELEPISLEEVINWFIPLKKNLQQPFCKAFARLELGFSRATPTYVFKPSQIREVDDILGDETPEASEYDDDDPQYAAEFGTGPFQRQVMNDGCAVMSQGAAREIWRAMGQTGPIPSVFQARIGGWKGLWIRGASAEAGPRDNEIWIEVSKSQKKFERPDEDFVDDTFDPIRLSFEVLNYSRPPTSASLHTSFIPILQDRGVPQEALETVVLDFLEYSRQEILYNLDHKDRLRSWLRTQFEGEQRPHDDAIQWYAGLPRLLQDKIVLLLESGFLPKKLPYLGNLFHLLLDSHFRKLTRNLRIPLPRSTMVYGIADPTGALLPGEIHLAFSGSFRAEDLNAGEEECFQFLNDRAVLVARHPALRNSDIQKVRAVYKMELSHIVDVVVFPSRGKFPLASKLQGGDYDGDTFWVCFEPSLVDSFKNAPAPRNLPGPENFGIRVDRRKLGDLVTNEKSLGLPLRRFVDEAFKFRCQPSYLGMVTNYHGNLAYKEDSINSDGVKDLASLHDHLIDSKKNGYTFDENMWRHFKEKHHALPNKPPEEPRYKAAMKEALEQNLGSGRRTETQPKHILDKIYFNVVFKHTRETLRRVKEVCADNEPGISDPDLENPYTSFLTRIDEEDLDIRGPIQDELRKLRSRLCAIRERWKQLWTNNEQVQKRYFDILDECFQMYTDIDPLNRDCAVIREWTVQDANNRPTTWELLKASAFFVECGAQDKLVFPIAGRQLAYLKADAAGDARLVHRDIYRTSKPK
ncbi:RNA dependent RNA polymerase-domain-containing protein, partial [Lineolata rhizophorae]